jgi:hypothetical protein
MWFQDRPKLDFGSDENPVLFELDLSNATAFDEARKWNHRYLSSRFEVIGIEDGLQRVRLEILV